MNKKYRIEACVETYKEALQAQINGADQIELCGNLDVGGVTPSKELIQRCADSLNLDIKVMIRPRGGNFEYTLDEVNLMKNQIEHCKALNVYGVVFGALKDGALDLNLNKELAILAAPLNVTIHKAIDSTHDILPETKRLLTISEHIDSILTSGGADTAEQGVTTLQEMISMTAGKINILPAGKITNENLESLHIALKTNAYHGRKIVGDLNKK